MRQRRRIQISGRLIERFDQPIGIDEVVVDQPRDDSGTSRSLVEAQLVQHAAIERVGRELGGRLFPERAGRSIEHPSLEDAPKRIAPERLG